MIEAERIADVLGGEKVLKRDISSLGELAAIVKQGLPKSALRVMASRLQTDAYATAQLMYRIVPKGHFPEAMHIELIDLIAELIPEGTDVVFLGDGEFDGITLQSTMKQAGWSYVCRTSYDTTASSEGEAFRLDAMGACLKVGHVVSLSQVLLTSKAYGPVMVICCWAKGNKEPLYLVSNMKSAELACRYYEKRFRIETFFSDQKSRGFHIQKSHLKDPQRLSRLLMASCLAYIWTVYLGSLCEKDGWSSIIPRRKRRDLSLFQLGLRLLEHFLNAGLPIPVQFHVTI